MRPIALHMSPAIAAQLRGGSAHCSVVHPGGISDSLDLEVVPFWSVPPSWVSYAVHLVIAHLPQDGNPFDQTTQKFTVPEHAILLNNVTANAAPYTFTNFWTSHPDYDGDHDIEPLVSGVSLLVTGVTGLGNLPALVQQVFSIITVQRLPATSQVNLDSVHIVDPNAGPSISLTFDPTTGNDWRETDSSDQIYFNGVLVTSGYYLWGGYDAGDMSVNAGPTFYFRMNSIFTGGGLATISATGYNLDTGAMLGANANVEHVSFEGSTFTSGTPIDGAIDMSVNANTNSLVFRFVVTKNGATSDPVYVQIGTA